MKNLIPILINDDGETWCGVDNASICLISKEEYEALADGIINTGELKPVFDLVLRDFTERNK